MNVAGQATHSSSRARAVGLAIAVAVSLGALIAQRAAAGPGERKDYGEWQGTHELLSEALKRTDLAPGDRAGLEGKLRSIEHEVADNEAARARPPADKSLEGPPPRGPSPTRAPPVRELRAGGQQLWKPSFAIPTNTWITTFGDPHISVMAGYLTDNPDTGIIHVWRVPAGFYESRPADGTPAGTHVERTIAGTGALEIVGVSDDDRIADLKTADGRHVYFDLATDTWVER